MDGFTIIIILPYAEQPFAVVVTEYIVEEDGVTFIV